MIDAFLLHLYARIVLQWRLSHFINHKIEYSAVLIAIFAIATSYTWCHLGLTSMAY